MPLKEVSSSHSIFSALERNIQSFLLIAGPCVIESESQTIEIARTLKTITERLGLPLLFKASFDKANRSSITSYRGVGIEEGLGILEKVKGHLQLPVTTDVHETWQVERVSPVVDVIQIPAFLCRQTDLLQAAARSGKPVNVKKGQFLAPEDMRHVVAKMVAEGAQTVFVTERGTTFGYHNLVVDMRSLAIMKALGLRVIFDATHAVQRPGSLDGRTGGDRAMVPVLARAAVAVGIDGLFLETHPDPDRAPSDGPNMLPLDQVEKLLVELLEIHRVRLRYAR
ncbi:MAG: 3-deoxy-8-phosphooctulonate synthase [Methylacidiphilales bacterium]|nr:3-deoxy-8-phosphooctulonate synthase [Candidatus Methylacidiphilales bacterium]MDW8349631.1 3-deoxy-8-phosphooctulonate synthase [Verrucomicrobiae bacterium]